MSSTPYYRVDPEHSGELGREVWVLGPPGTGKTTFLSGSVRNTALQRGSDNVVVASFTVTAAAELQGRGLPLPKSQVGTLHSLCYRQLDHPPVVEEQLIEWNKAHPALAVTIKPGARSSLDDGAPPEAWTGATEGDVLMSELDSLRARTVPKEEWPTATRHFSEKWTDWKRANGLIDFTDMIELALTDVDNAPGNPDVGYFDEAQDFTPLEFALIRKWGSRMERIVIAGDDDQAIYGFKGATPKAWLEADVDDGDKLVLSQSWRIPASVHRAAEHWIKTVSLREPKLYHPREEEGLVAHKPLTYDNPLSMVRELDKALSRTVIDADSGEERPATVMVLATCAYMIDPLKHELRKAGLPFHNPYRKTRSDWNPLKPAKGVSSRERLLSYLILDDRQFGDDSRPWTGEDIRKWSHVIKTQGLMVRGAKGLIAEMPNGEVDYDSVASLFLDDVELEQAVEPSLDWFARNLLAGSKPGLDFPIAIARNKGALALRDEPRLTIGTIHSVKGGQADFVYLMPDLSARGNNEWAKIGEPRDGVIRQFYVGMTRARHELVVCGPSTSYFVSPEKLVAGARAGSA